MVVGKLMRLQLKYLINAGIFRRLSRLPQRELWRALRDIQKPAASETK